MSDTRNHKCDSGNFDRTICPEPCGRMHSYCDICGERQDSCAHDEPTDTRNHTTRDQLAAALREHDPEPYFPGNWEDEAYYQGFADALLASDAIAAVRAAAVAETTATIEAVLPDDKPCYCPECEDNPDQYRDETAMAVRAALSGGRTALDTRPPVDPDDLCLTCGATSGVCGCPEPAEEQPR